MRKNHGLILSHIIVLSGMLFFWTASSTLAIPEDALNTQTEPVKSLKSLSGASHFK